MTRQEFVQPFGEHRIGALVQDQKEIRLAPDFIRTLWQMPDERGLLVPMLGKDQETPPFFDAFTLVATGATSTGSLRPDKPARPELTGITVQAGYPDGASRVHTFNPRHLEALFWSDWPSRRSTPRTTRRGNDE